MDTALSICVGIGLSAACGFRVFVPLLIMSIASLSGHLTLASSFQWIGTYPAIIAGTIVTSSMLINMDPFLKWTLAVMAGGGVAGVVQSGTILTRAASTTTTGGLGNPLVATAELALSIFTSILALVLPILAALLVLVLLFV